MLFFKPDYWQIRDGRYYARQREGLLHVDFPTAGWLEHIQGDSPLEFQARPRWDLEAREAGVTASLATASWELSLSAPITPNAPLIPARDLDGAGQIRDGMGCFLSYPLFPGFDFKVEKEGDSFFTSPEAVEKADWGIWVRCSDSGLNSGFTLVTREEQGWRPTAVYCRPAPHYFPITSILGSWEVVEEFRKLVQELPNTPEGAFRLAEHIIEFS